MNILTDKDGNITIHLTDGFGSDAVVEAIVNLFKSLMESSLFRNPVNSGSFGRHIRIRISSAESLAYYNSLVVKLGAVFGRTFSVCWQAVGDGKFIVVSTSDAKFPLGFVERQ